MIPSFPPESTVSGPGEPTRPSLSPYFLASLPPTLPPSSHPSLLLPTTLVPLSSPDRKGKTLGL